MVDRISFAPAKPEKPDYEALHAQRGDDVNKQ
jgi:hypothetical protein